jgi:hypothetical protein
VTRGAQLSGWRPAARRYPGRGGLQWPGATVGTAAYSGAAQSHRANLAEAYRRRRYSGTFAPICTASMKCVPNAPTNAPYACPGPHPSNGGKALGWRKYRSSTGLDGGVCARACAGGGVCVCARVSKARRCSASSSAHSGVYARAGWVVRESYLFVLIPAGGVGRCCVCVCVCLCVCACGGGGGGVAGMTSRAASGFAA